MSKMKRYAEEVSVEMGFDGILADEVLAEAQRRLDEAKEGKMRTKFAYEVSLHVEFTEDELAIIQNCAANHYDGTVKASVKQGGFVYGWRNHFEMSDDRTLISCSSGELDTCCKALEQPASATESEEARTARWRLRDRMGIALNSTINETRRVNVQMLM